MTMKQVGAFSVTAVTDGIIHAPVDVVLRLPKDEALRIGGSSDGKTLPIEVNCHLIRHNGKLILSDAGAGHSMSATAGKLPQNLRAIGVDPADIDIILMTHLHGDHSLGLLDPQDKPIYPKAELMLHELEAAFWLDREPLSTDSERIARNTALQRKVTAPYRDRIRRIKAGEVMPGITAQLRPGHTPGHTNWLIESNGERLLLWGDIVHLTAVQMSRPQTRLVYDYDTDLAAETRDTVLAWVAREGITVAGAHLAYPSFARVVRSGDGYSLSPP